MHFIVFAISYPFIWVFSRLPMRILYGISDILFIFIYYIFGYRKKVVLDNLTLAYPHKTKTEINEITKRFFKHFADSFLETVKGLSISKKEVNKRYRYTNPELVNTLVAEGKSIALVRAHYANWEWCLNMPLVLNTNVNTAYTTIGNPYFNALVKKSREKFGINCYASAKSVKAIHNDFKNNIQGIYLLISDQSPQLHKATLWTNFFGVHVPVYTGAEALAKKFDLAVINCATKKIKRGYYETEFQLITKDPKKESNHKITNDFLQHTEAIVNEFPEYYLWSHKRFKHKDRYNEWKSLKISQSKKKR